MQTEARLRLASVLSFRFAVSGSHNTVRLPYVLGDGERAGDVTVALRTEQGLYQQTECEYDGQAAAAVVRLKHFSDYVVAAFPFDDVGRDRWYYNSVLSAYLGGIFEGDAPRSFAPEKTTTRAMLITALWRIEGSPAPKAASIFADVPQGEWYSAAVAWANENGIADGYGSRRFGPLDELDRQQMMTLIYRYEQYKGGGFTGSWMFRLSYADAVHVSDWAYEAVCWCTMKGIVDGVGQNLLSPGGRSDRAQLSAVLSRYGALPKEK